MDELMKYSTKAVDHDPFQISPVQRAVLTKIASGEATAYDQLYGGHSFRSYHDHPRVAIKIPASGKFSTAAGLYQITAPTWDGQKKRLGLKDFSPASQDLAAWDLADRTYRQQTGRDLAADAARNSVNWGALSNQWTSLKGPVRAQAASWGPGATVLPSNIAPVSRNSLELAPIPAMGEPPELQPIAFHPLFTKPRTSSASPFLRPVNYDPFAQEPATP